MPRASTVFAALLSLSLLGSAGCSTSLTTPNPPSRPLIHLVQEVSGLEVSVAESCPPQVMVLAEIGRGACDQVIEPEVVRDGSEITILIWTRVEDPNGICIMPLVGETVRVNLGSDFAPGEYRIHAPSGSSRVGDAAFRYPDDC